MCGALSGAAAALFCVPESPGGACGDEIDAGTFDIGENDRSGLCFREGLLQDPVEQSGDQGAGQRLVGTDTLELAA